MHYLLCIFIFLFYPLHAETLLLKERFAKAHPGDFVVIEFQNTYTLFHIKDSTPNFLGLEEISVPEYRAPKSITWQQWLQDKAPYHTSWIYYKFNLKTSKIENIYSVSEKAQLEHGSMDAFLTHLLNLKFQLVPLSKRIRSGQPPNPGEKDERAIWQPSVKLNGRFIEHIELDVWQAVWPQDQSELAGKTIEIYLPKETCSELPNYFPLWLQIKDKWKRVKLRIIDISRARYTS